MALCCLIQCASAQHPTTQPYTWKPVSIVGGGFVTGIVTHPTEKNLFYIRTDVGGAYRWDEPQQRWMPITDWITADRWSDMGIESIAIDPNDPERVYMAVGTYTTNWSPINGAILRSSDRGKTWHRTDLPFKNGGNEPGRGLGERLIVDPNDSNVIYFGTRVAGMWKSVDRGVTWARVESFPEIATSESAQAADSWKRPLGIGAVMIDAKNKVIYAAVATRQNSIYRSIDSGATWEAIPNQPTGLRPNHIALASDGMLYFSYGDEAGPSTMTDGAIWKLDPRTSTWTDITPEKPTADRKFGYGSVTVDPRNPNTIMCSTFCRWNGDDHIYRSIDGGKNWKSVRASATLDWSAAPWLTWGRSTLRIGHWICDVEIDPHDSNRVLYVTGWGVWMSRDATAVDRDEKSHWAFTRGIEECVVNHIVSPPNGAPLLSVMWDIDGFRHENLDVSPPGGFFMPHKVKNTDIDFAEKNPDIVVRVYGGQNTHGAISTDNGRTWTEFASAPEGKGEGHIAVSSDGATIVSTPSEGTAQVSRDRGATWIKCEGIPQHATVISDRVDFNRFYAFDSREGTIYVSDDAGTRFVKSSATLPRQEGYLRAVPGQAGVVYFACRAGLFRSSDIGASFAQVQGIDRAHRVGFGKPAPGKTDPAIYLIGTTGDIYGFFRSDDTGKTWVRINDDAHQYGGVNSITGDPRVYGRVYVGSSNRGIVYGEPLK